MPVLPILQSPHSDTAAAGAGKASVLIVEDDPNSAFILQKILLRTDYTVVGVANSGDQALALARAHKPDLMLMDINIPGSMDGVETATKLLQFHEAPIIYLSAFSDDATIERASRTAPFAYLLKPYREKEVLITIQMALYKARLDRLRKISERRLAATLGALDDAVLTADASGRLTSYNSAAERLLGWEGKSRIGQHLATSFDLRERETRNPLPGLAENLLRPNFQTEPAHPLVLLAGHGGQHLVQVHTHALEEPEGGPTGIVVILRDVTQIVHLEESIRQAQKLEAVGRLAGGIAHDFNNLLAIINSFADLLLLKAPPSDPLEKYYRNIRTAGQRGSDLVAQLMTFSRRHPASPRLVQPAEVVTDAHKMLRPLIRENIELALELPPLLPALLIDPGQVEQILVNLCLNARDAIVEAGRISITLSTRKLGEREAAERDLKAAGEYLVLSVSDNGSGIPEDIRGKIFEPFFTTKEVGRGTGLGLAMVYSLVKQNRGHIEVQSEVGLGTTFTIFLPPAVAPGMFSPPADTEPVVPPGGTERLLLVEDDSNFSECVKSLLDMHGYKTTAAADGQEALRLYREHEGKFDLLLADVVLPKLSGQKVAEELRRERPGLPVLFMSGYDGEEPGAGLGAGTARLQKPFPLNTLLYRIRSLLDQAASAPVSTNGHRR